MAAARGASWVAAWARRSGSLLQPRAWPAAPEAFAAQFEWRDMRVLLLGVMHGSPASFEYIDKVCGGRGA